MSDLDFDELARLWQASDTSEQEATEALAQKVKIRARLLGLRDTMLLIVLIVSLVVDILLRPGPATEAIGAAVIAIGLWLNWRLRVARQAALQTSNRPHFLRLALDDAKARRIRALLSMILLPCFALLAILFKVSYRNGGHLDHPLHDLAAWTVSTHGIIVIPTIVILMLYLTQSYRKIIREYQSIKELQIEYREESILDEDESNTDLN